MQKGPIHHFLLCVAQCIPLIHTRQPALLSWPSIPEKNAFFALLEKRLEFSGKWLQHKNIWWKSRRVRMKEMIDGFGTRISMKSFTHISISQNTEINIHPHFNHWKIYPFHTKGHGPLGQLIKSFNMKRSWNFLNRANWNRANLIGLFTANICRTWLCVCFCFGLWTVWRSIKSNEQF